MHHHHDVVVYSSTPFLSFIPGCPIVPNLTVTLLYRRPLLSEVACESPPLANMPAGVVCHCPALELFLGLLSATSGLLEDCEGGGQSASCLHLS